MIGARRSSPCAEDNLLSLIEALNKAHPQYQRTHLRKVSVSSTMGVGVASTRHPLTRRRDTR